MSFLLFIQEMLLGIAEKSIKKSSKYLRFIDLLKESLTNLCYIKGTVVFKFKSIIMIIIVEQPAVGPANLAQVFAIIALYNTACMSS